MDKPFLLDGFCGAGGCTKGYQMAGFYVVGIDIEPQPRYVGDDFIQMDALEALRILIGGGCIVGKAGREYYLSDFAVIHASPPCQGYSGLRFNAESYDKLIPQVRSLLRATGKTYVIENVEGARREMENYLMLCGTMFDLRVRRHRLFECNPPLFFSPFSCNHFLKVVKKGRTPDPTKHLAAIHGHFSDQEYARRAMGIDWMNRDELGEAIPPAYTRWLGKQLLSILQTEAL